MVSWRTPSDIGNAIAGSSATLSKTGLITTSATAATRLILTSPLSSSVSERNENMRLAPAIGEILLNVGFIFSGANSRPCWTSDEETAALDYFQELSERADLEVALNLAPGDAYVANNYTVLHSRTAFEDHVADNEQRYLLRLWLKTVDGRPVVDAVRRFYRDDGISAREGAGTVYVHAGAGQAAK